MDGVRIAFLVGVLCLLQFLSVDAGIASEDNSNRISRGFDAKSMLTNLATNIMSRGYGGGGGSQVVSLNLTNLLVLVLLKALIFAAGSLGAGTWKGGLARSLDGEEALISDEELLFYITYLTGEPGNNTCLQNLACQRPEEAKKYASAGEMLLKTAKMLSIDGGDNYQFTLQELEEAASYGKRSGDCSRYTCGENSIKDPY